MIHQSSNYSVLIISICETPIEKHFDFYTIKPEDLLEFEVDLDFIIPKTTLLHGISSWFDTYFKGCNKDVTLSTSPYSTPTHWYQIRLLLPEPLAINKGQRGKVDLLYSYWKDVI
jgi:histone-arginine methyltransferase CARM1